MTDGGNNIEHWHCKLCDSLTSETEKFCWNCRSAKGTEPTPENVAAAKWYLKDVHGGSSMGCAIMVAICILLAFFIFVFVHTVPFPG